MILHQPHNSRGNYNYNANIYRNLKWVPHFHKNFELIYTLEGAVNTVIGGKQYLLSAGQAALVLSNQVHSFYVPDDSLAVVIVFSEEYVPKFASQIKGLQGDTSVFALSDSVAWLFKEHIVERDSTVLMKKACFYAICDEFLSSVVLQERQEGDKSSIVKILDWISRNYTEDISLKEVANLFGYEYHYLSRLLNKTYNISFNQLVNGYRVEKAIELLCRIRICQLRK